MDGSKSNRHWRRTVDALKSCICRHDNENALRGFATFVACSNNSRLGQQYYIFRTVPRNHTEEQEDWRVSQRLQNISGSGAAPAAQII